MPSIASKPAPPIPMPYLRPSAYGHRREFLQLTAALMLSALPRPARATTPNDAREMKLIVFGDSLVAGFGLPAEAAFPAVLEKTLRAEGYDVKIVNAGVSGETSSGGLARLDWTLAEGADGVILELGANDMLRGIDPNVTEAALDAILAELKARNIKTLIAGMKATPSLGQDYKTRFDAIYPDLATKYGVPLYPFFLEGVVGDSTLKLPDGLHPSSAGVERIIQAILPDIRTFIEKLGLKPQPDR
jgi:acyl-CoA thioesterase I